MPPRIDERGKVDGTVSGMVLSSWGLWPSGFRGSMSEQEYSATQTHLKAVGKQENK